MMNNPKIFVIVVTYKGQRWYDKCFGSLRESTIPLQVIAVDNTPDDEDAEYIKSHFPEVHLIKTRENLGFGRANNLGMRYALDNGCDYVFLLNQDAWIEPETLPTMIPIADRHPECGIFSPMQISADGKSLNIELEDGSTDHGISLLSDCYYRTIKDLYRFRYIGAAAWLLPRKTIEMVGGYDPMFFMYGEDDNYLHRLEYHNLWVGLIPKTCIMHDHPKEDYNPLQETMHKTHGTDKLVRYLNILNTTSVNQHILHNLYRLVLSLLCFNGNKIRQHWEEICFLQRNKRKIVLSRKKNMEIGAAWL